MRNAILAVLVAGILSGRLAMADPIVLPSAVALELSVGSQSVGGGQSFTGPFSSAMTLSFANNSADGGAATATAGLSPGASASASGTGSAESSPVYFFDVSGPVDTSVPIVIGGLLGATLGPDVPQFDYAAEAFSVVQVDYTSVRPDETILELFDCERAPGYGNAGCGNGVFTNGSFADSVSIDSNTEFAVYLGAVANPDNGNISESVTASAAASAFIQIDPTFAADNPGFSVQASPGVSNTPLAATPEPSGLSLMMLALGVMGSQAFRLKTAAS